MDETLEILGQIAESYPPESIEYQALIKACHAVFFVQHNETKDRFEQFIKEMDRPLNGLDLIKLKVYGIEIPEECRTTDIVALEAEIDALAEKIRTLK